MDQIRGFRFVRGRCPDHKTAWRPYQHW